MYNITNNVDKISVGYQTLILKKDGTLYALKGKTSWKGSHTQIESYVIEKVLNNGVEKLPAIIAIVTYNGLEKHWDVEQKIVSEFGIFKDDIFRYAVVNITKVNVKALLEEGENVLSPIVFYLEQVRDDTEKLIKRLKEGLQIILCI